MVCLSPLTGAFFLKRLDAMMEASGLFYVRFMDDILVLVPTRWRLRKAVKAVNEVLGSLWLLKHPDKTFVGRTERGFDFLDYHFGPEGLTGYNPGGRRAEPVPFLDLTTVPLSCRPKSSRKNASITGFAEAKTLENMWKLARL